ncbi:MAG: single-stranded DNA-binding protein [Bacteroidales bacterium]|jgi:single-strand DNA-binding protein
MSRLNNRVMLTGNIGKDPEVTYNANNTVVAKMVLATNDGYKDRSGQWVEKTTWHNLSCWGELAKRAERLIQKGTCVSIDGKLAVDTWSDSNGEKRYFTYVLVDEFRINSGGRKQENDPYNEITDLP